MAMYPLVMRNKASAAHPGQGVNPHQADRPYLAPPGHTLRAPHGRSHPAAWIQPPPALPCSRRPLPRPRSRVRRAPRSPRRRRALQRARSRRGCPPGRLPGRPLAGRHPPQPPSPERARPRAAPARPAESRPPASHSGAGANSSKGVRTRLSKSFGPGRGTGRLPAASSTAVYKLACRSATLNPWRHIHGCLHSA
jgi:hypothetical protein